MFLEEAEIEIEEAELEIEEAEIESEEAEVESEFFFLSFPILGISSLGICTLGTNLEDSTFILIQKLIACFFSEKKT